MRPIDKGLSPAIFTNYEDAQQPLANRLGTYCSYCERYIATGLAIEHILPKDEDLPYAHLRNEWSNFLLSCVNCNSSKGITIPYFEWVLLPDRDNTFSAFLYDQTGIVTVIPTLLPQIKQMAENILQLVNLNPDPNPAWDEKKLFAALQRTNQRKETWKMAIRNRLRYDKGELDAEAICDLASCRGFFSIWMAAFDGVPAVRNALIQQFEHTATDCFDANGQSISPRPSNNLQYAGKC